MIGYKLWSECPVDKRLPDIPLDTPWQVQTLLEDDTVESMQALGFTVVSDADFSALMAEKQPLIDSWVAAHPPTPAAVTPRQIRLALIMSGISLSTIESGIAALSEPTRSIAQVTWEYSVEFQRNNPLINALAPSLGLSISQVDALFRLAATL